MRLGQSSVSTIHWIHISGLQLSMAELLHSKIFTVASALCVSFSSLREHKADAVALLLNIIYIKLPLFFFLQKVRHEE